VFLPNLFHICDEDDVVPSQLFHTTVKDLFQIVELGGVDHMNIVTTENMRGG
jgi:hypothetical protein